jgi:hypothetical protein
MPRPPCRHTRRHTHARELAIAQEREDDIARYRDRGADTPNLAWKNS